MIGNAYSIGTGGAYKDDLDTLGNALSFATDGHFLDEIAPTTHLARAGRADVGTRLAADLSLDGRLSARVEFGPRLEAEFIEVNR